MIEAILQKLDTNKDQIKKKFSKKEERLLVEKGKVYLNQVRHKIHVIHKIRVIHEILTWSLSQICDKNLLITAG
jgi:hypothetical protein